jgi:hypothetical protein
MALGKTLVRLSAFALTFNLKRSRERSRRRSSSSLATVMASISLSRREARSGGASTIDLRASN